MFDTFEEPTLRSLQAPLQNSWKLALVVTDFVFLRCYRLRELSFGLCYFTLDVIKNSACNNHLQYCTSGGFLEQSVMFLFVVLRSRPNNPICFIIGIATLMRARTAVAEPKADALGH